MSKCSPRVSSPGPCRGIGNRRPGVLDDGLRESERASQQLQALGVETVLDIVESGEHLLTELLDDVFWKTMERIPSVP